MSFLRLGLLSLVLTLVILFGASSVQAQTATQSGLIARMNAIIVEMDALKREFATLKDRLSGESYPTPVTTTNNDQGSVLGAATTNLQNTVVSGLTNETIAKVQRLLATDSEIYPYGVDSGFFGPKTLGAI